MPDASDNARCQSACCSRSWSSGRAANDSEYGPSGGIRTADPDRALAVARRPRTGTVSLNGAPMSFDGAFGGYQSSGIGREYGRAG